MSPKYKHPVNVKHIEQRSFSLRFSDAISAFCGRIEFVYIHTIIFALWIITKGFGYDSFPFNFLTMAVSLEAIYLSTFILISQNRQTQHDRMTLEHNSEETDQLMKLQESQMELLNAIKEETALLKEIHRHLDPKNKTKPRKVK